MVFAGVNMLLCDYRAKVVRDLEILVFMSMADVLQLERTTCLGLRPESWAVFLLLDRLH